MSIDPIRPTSSSSLTVTSGASQMLRFAPEPRSIFGDIVKTATSAMSQVASTAEATMPGLGGVQQFEDLLTQQILIQQQMQEYSMRSNIAKSAHEIAMAPVRNLRVG
jgi:hypothetical protein